MREISLVECIQPLQSGKRPKGGVAKILEGIPSLGAEHIDAFGGFYFDHIRFIPESFYFAMKSGVIRKGDILVVKDGATTGRVALVDENFPFEKAAINEHVFLLRPKEKYSGQLLVKILMSEIGQKAIDNNFRGGAQGGINQDFIDEIRFLCPDSLEAQENFARNLQSKLANVEKIRQITLKQKQAAKALQSAILQEVFPWQVGEPLPQGWRWENLGTHAKFKNGLNYSSSDIQPGIKVIGVSSFQDHFFLEEVNDTEIRKEKVREGDLLKKNDILIVRSNGSPELVGRHLLFIGEEKVTHSGFTIRLRLDESVINPIYYMYFVRSELFKKQTRGQGANIKNVSQKKLSGVHIPLPKEMEDQLPIVQTIKNRLEIAKKTLSSIENQLSAIEALPAAILREAFNFEINEN